jgi:hypothetical protein
MKKIFFIIFYSLCSLTIYAKTGLSTNGIWGDCHSKDQMLVLGLFSEKKQDTTNQNYKKIGILLSDFNYWIDDAHSEGENSNFYNKLKAKYPGFTWHQYTHRLMFHWGYDWHDPIGNNALKIAFFKLNDGYSQERTTEQIKMFDSFINDIEEEQRQREYKMSAAVAYFFGTGGATTFNHSIGALIYYTHLLGDHVVHSNSYSEEAVLSTTEIMRKIKIEVGNLTPNETLRKRCAKEIDSFNTDWKKLNNSALTNEALAEQALNVMEQKIPPILKKTWKSTFTNAGLVFVY